MSDLPISLKEYSDLVSLIYQASIDESRWQEFLEKLALVTDTQKSQIYGFDAKANETFGLVTTGYDSEATAQYLNYYYKHNFWAQGLVNVKAGFASDLAFVVDRVDLSKSEYYNDWILPQENIISSAGAVLFNEDSRALFLGANYRAKDSIKAKDNWLSLTKLLVPHIQQSFSLSAEIAHKQLDIALGAAGEVHGELGACIAVSENGQILYANAYARELLNVGDVVRLDFGHRLGFEFEKLEAPYLKLLDDMKQNEGAFSFQMPIYHPRRGALSINFARIQSGEFRVPQLFDYDRPCLLITITRNRENQLVMQRLVHQYGLTEAESEVAAMFHLGMTINEISDAKAKSVYTVRNQIKTVMQKTGARTQVQLLLQLSQIG